MGCLSRLVVIVALAVQVVASVLGLIVLGSAGVLGEAAIISADDALVLFIALSLSLLATLVLAIKLWLGSRKRKRLEHALAGASTSSNTCCIEISRTKDTL